MNKRIVHIVNSMGFLNWIKRSFENDSFENQFVLFHPTHSKLKNVGNDIVEIINTKKDLKRLLDLINESDLVIHYFLNVEKAELILKSSSKVKHYWYFFGADVYQQFPRFKSVLYGQETKSWINQSFIERNRLFLRNIKRWIKFKSSVQKTLIKSFGRIENVLWYIEDEINWIAEKLPLPVFSYYRFFSLNDVFPFSSPQLETKDKKILVGNSSTPENNHLDLLPFLSVLPNCYKLTLPLNYGDLINYKREIKSKFNGLHLQIDYVENFMPLKEYNNLLSLHPTAVFFTKRQQALGNIFFLLANGSKVYLSKENIVFTWLKKNEVLIYSVEDDLESDVQSENLCLKNDQIQNNFTQITRLFASRSCFSFKLKKNT